MDLEGSSAEPWSHATQKKPRRGGALRNCAVLSEAPPPSRDFDGEEGKRHPAELFPAHAWPRAIRLRAAAASVGNATFFSSSSQKASPASPVLIGPSM
jgi:hypothetical protein